MTPLIGAMIKVTAPKIGETIYDGAVSSAGFLCEAYDYLRTDKLSASEYETLQTKTFYGQEKKGLAYIIGIMNMVLHGIEAPKTSHVCHTQDDEQECWWTGTHCQCE